LGVGYWRCLEVGGRELGVERCLRYRQHVRTIEQAGAIIAGLRNGEPATLLVTGKRNPAHWIFPKGHVERGESLDETALREAEEEAGVRGTLLGPAGALSFVDRGQTIRVHYFVVLTRDDGTPEKRPQGNDPSDVSGVVASAPAPVRRSRSRRRTGRPESRSIGSRYTARSAPDVTLCAEGCPFRERHVTCQ
jgi:8-oxo-dGTP pyrophosphatase MutT (NUDIX family)